MKRLNITGSLLIFVLSSVSLQGQNKRIYIAADDHSDIWWSADLETYYQAFLSMLDYYISLADNTQD